MGNSLLAVRGINHKYIVVDGGAIRYFEKQMYFMLGDDCEKLCANYSFTGDGKLMRKETILQGLKRASEEFYQPYFLHSRSEDILSLYSDSELLELLEGHVIKHIVPYEFVNSSEIFQVVRVPDIIFTIRKENIDRVQNNKIKNCILIVQGDEIPLLGGWIEKIIPYLERINLKCEVRNKTELNQYEEQLQRVETIFLNQIKDGHFCEISVLTDRLYVEGMENCFAGEKNITLAPDGKYYTCPAFYYHRKRVQEPEFVMTRLERSPVCKVCDAYQCERCVYLNKERTLEYNVPSELQCLKSHRERKRTMHLQEELEKNFPSVNFMRIAEVNYDDPCQKVMWMWG